jgi:hypothetical protein
MALLRHPPMSALRLLSGVMRTSAYDCRTITDLWVHAPILPRWTSAVESLRPRRARTAPLRYSRSAGAAGIAVLSAQCDPVPARSRPRSAPPVRGSIAARGQTLSESRLRTKTRHPKIPIQKRDRPIVAFRRSRKGLTRVLGCRIATCSKNRFLAQG